MKKHTKGLFISFEGPDKAGKSTQIKLLSENLNKAGYQTLLTREPGGTKLGEEIRNILLNFKDENICPEAELLLFGASRAQLIHQFIKPNLAAGKIILCDRFIDSTSAYQGKARGIDMNFIETLHDFCLAGYEPDITIFLDLEVSESLARLRKIQPDFDDDDRFEEENQQFHQLVREGFLEQAAKNKERIRCFDATLPIELLADKIFQELKNVLG